MIITVADLFMTPTAELADIVLPVAVSFEREGLKIGFEVSLEAQSFIQIRPPVVPPPGEARLPPARPDRDHIAEPAMAQTIAIERVDHIGIRVRDPRPRPGLHRVLGFTLVHRAVGDDVAIVNWPPSYGATPDSITTIT